MKKLTLFTLNGCPYCREAEIWIKELKEEDPELRNVKIERIEESENPEIAEAHDYWYVPTFYLEETKIHEGVATKEIIRNCLKKAL